MEAHIIWPFEECGCTVYVGVDSVERIEKKIPFVLDSLVTVTW